MTTEIENLVAEAVDRENLARLFDRVAEILAAPLEFKRGGEASVEEVVDGIDKGGVRGE